ncbi:WAT1-related protein At1g25270-like isoform X2 [Ziziphus jujuba]|nr:WAT1-related protein At1g25270-like isoform X2 [Ziziphus jujuba]
MRPKPSWKVVFQSFLCGLFGGSMAQNLYLESLSLTSVTFASAMSNLVPAITFILAVSFRLEKANLGKMSGKVKVIGSSMGIGGAMLLTLYKGVEINIWNTHVNLLHPNSHNSAASNHSHSADRIIGALMAIGSCFSYAIWLIVQAKVTEIYPYYYSSTALMSSMGAIQATVFALAMDRDWNGWRLGWNIRLLTVAYSGIVASGLMVTLMAWCVHMRGPLFVSVFNPLLLVLVAIASSLVLNENLHLGSILAAGFIVLGLYLVLWGKSKEMKKKNQLAPSENLDEPDSISIVITTPPTDNNKHHAKKDNNDSTNDDNNNKNDNNIHSNDDHNNISRNITDDQTTQN